MSDRRPSLTLVLMAEWGKLWRLPSTWVCLGVSVLVHAAIGLWVGYNASTPQALEHLLTVALVVSQVPILVLGVLTSADEHTTAGASTTYLAVPTRLPVLAARCLAVVPVAALAGVLAPTLTHVLLHTIVDRPGAVIAGDVRLIVLGTAVYLSVACVLAVGIGAILRRTVAATVAAITLMVLLEHVMTIVGGDAAQQLRSLLPGWAGRQAIEPATDLSGYGILVTWTVVAVIVAAVVVRRSDV